MGQGVTWRVVGASSIGTSHVRSGTPCQDSCWAQVGQLLNGAPLLTMFVADGAGSAINGGLGADLAIETAAELMTQKAIQGEFDLDDQLATDLLLAIRNRIFAEAEAQHLKARDYACTFLGVVSSPTGTLVFQIGDGAVVLDTGTGLEIAIIPMSGEYANMTHFATDENAVEILVSKTYPGKALKVAAFSDGIQRLALNLASNTPYEPFFAPFFTVMATATADQEDQLHNLLLKFLNSAPVNERTDDDKTLAFAHWMH